MPDPQLDNPALCPSSIHKLSYSGISRMQNFKDCRIAISALCVCLWTEEVQSMVLLLVPLVPMHAVDGHASEQSTKLTRRLRRPEYVYASERCCTPIISVSIIIGFSAHAL